MSKRLKCYSFILESNDFKINGDSKIIDLHIHSVVSDGTFTPGELVEKAAREGVSALALADHDSVDGIADFMAAGEKFGVKTVPAVEISTALYTKEAHIVGLFVDPECITLQKKLAAIREDRTYRNRQIEAKLNLKGYAVSLDNLEKESGSHSVGRPHFAAFLLENYPGDFESMQDVFEKCLRRGAAAYCPRRLPQPEEAIGVIHEAGGLAIWAHPSFSGNRERYNIRKVLKRLVPAGLDGIEAYYPAFDEAKTALVLEFAESFGIGVSGGSDFHGDNHPGVALGRGYGELNIPEEVLEALLIRHQERYSNR